MNRSLKQLQESFQAYMLEQDNSVLNEIVDTTQVPATIRLNIYRDAYHLRLLDILAMHYPVLKKFTGATFSELGRAYISSYPSHNFSIRIFGHNFDEFLIKNSNFAPIFGEIANFEWYLAEIQDAPDDNYLTLEEVGKIPPEMWGAMQLTCHPTARLASFHYNVAEIWQACNEEKELPNAELKKNSNNFLFWRFELEPRFMPVTELQVKMFKKINENKSFGEICEEMCEYVPEEEVIQFAAGTLREWILAGVFSNCGVDQPLLG